MEYNISFGKSSNPMQLKNEQHIIYPILILYETQAQMTNIEIGTGKQKQKQSDQKFKHHSSTAAAVYDELEHARLK